MAKKYDYNGNIYTLTELNKYSAVSQKTLSKRLSSGWSVKQAVETPTAANAYMKREQNIPKEIQIIFSNPIPGVFEHMQPIIGKEYTAQIHICNQRTQMCKVFYSINLARGQPLIVYDGEFEVVESKAAKAA